MGRTIVSEIGKYNGNRGEYVIGLMSVIEQEMEDREIDFTSMVADDALCASYDQNHGILRGICIVEFGNLMYQDGTIERFYHCLMAPLQSGLFEQALLEAPEIVTERDLLKSFYEATRRYDEALSLLLVHSVESQASNVEATRFCGQAMQ